MTEEINEHESCWAGLELEPRERCQNECGWLRYEAGEWIDGDGKVVLKYEEGEEPIVPGLYCPVCGSPVNFNAEGNPVAGPPYRPAQCPCPMVERSDKLLRSTKCMEWWGAGFAILAVALFGQGTIALWSRAGEVWNVQFGCGMLAGTLLVWATIYIVEQIWFKKRRATVRVVVGAMDPETGQPTDITEDFIVRGYKFPTPPDPKPRKPRKKGPKSFERNPDYVPPTPAWEA